MCVCVCVCVCVYVCVCGFGINSSPSYSNLTFPITLNCLPRILIDPHLYITAVLGNFNHLWSNYSSLGLYVFYNQNDYMLFLRFWDTDSIQRRLLARKAGRKGTKYPRFCSLRRGEAVGWVALHPWGLCGAGPLWPHTYAVMLQAPTPSLALSHKKFQTK